MNAEFVDPFIQASQLVFTKFANIHIRPGKIYEKTSPDDCNVAILLGLSGKIKGQVVFYMKENIACEIASSMMKMGIDKLDSMSKSAITELANIIMGKTASMLSEKGFNVEISPPSFLADGDFKSVNKSLRSFYIPFEFENGSKVEAEISII